MITYLLTYYHNPPNYDPGYRIFNVHKPSLCMRIVYTRPGVTSVYSPIGRIAVESAESLAPEKFRGGREA